MSYKDSDHTIVIALVCWPKRMNFGAETHLGGGIMSAFAFLSTAIAWVPHFNVCWQYGSQERPTKILAPAMISIMHWHLCAKN